MLFDSDDIVADADVAEIFNQFCVTIAESLSISESTKYPASTNGLSDPVFVAINKFSNYPVL